MTSYPGFLLRVGIEGTSGGVYGPIYQSSGRFEFIPIPETHIPIKSLDTALSKLRRERVVVRRYRDIEPSNPSKSLKRISSFLPEDHLTVRQNSHDVPIEYSRPPDLIPHDDPDFGSKTFGDYWGMIPKYKLRFSNEEREALFDSGYVHLTSKLWVFFVTSLWSTDKKWYLDNRLLCSEMKSVQRDKERRSVYLTGVFQIEHIADIGKLRGWDRTLRFIGKNNELKRRIKENFHYKRHRLLKYSRKRMDLDSSVVILFGNPAKSRLLPYAIPLKEGSTTSRPNALGRMLGLKERDSLRGPRPLDDRGCKAALTAIND